MIVNKKAACLLALRERILSTELEPGADLDELSLCETYGVSRTPLREVLQRLSGEGLIQLEENRGAKVASMDVRVMRTFFQTAPLVYANISALAAENWAGPQLDTLKQTQSAFAVAMRRGEASEAALLNHRFHAEIGLMADNAWSAHMLHRSAGIGDDPVPRDQLNRLITQVLDNHVVGMQPHTARGVRLFRKKLGSDANAHTVGHHLATSAHGCGVTR